MSAHPSSPRTLLNEKVDVNCLLFVVNSRGSSDHSGSNRVPINQDQWDRKFLRRPRLINRLGFLISLALVSVWIALLWLTSRIRGWDPLISPNPKGETQNGRIKTKLALETPAKGISAMPFEFFLPLLQRIAREELRVVHDRGNPFDGRPEAVVSLRSKDGRAVEVHGDELLNILTNKSTRSLLQTEFAEDWTGRTIYHLPLDRLKRALG